MENFRFFRPNPSDFFFNFNGKFFEYPVSFFLKLLFLVKKGLTLAFLPRGRAFLTKQRQNLSFDEKNS